MVASISFDVSITIAGRSIVFIVVILCTVKLLAYGLCLMSTRPPVACVEYQSKLGNQLFTYAFHFTLAKEKGLKMIGTGEIEFFNLLNVKRSSFLSEDEYFSCCMLWRFERGRCIEKDEITDFTSLCKSVPKGKYTWGLNYQNEVHTLPLGEDVNIFGYFMSWRYWMHLEKEIRKQFSFKQHVIEHASTTLRTFPNQKNCGINRVKNRVKITQFTRDLHTIFSYANELTKSCYKIVKKSENDFLQNQKTIFSKIRKWFSQIRKRFSSKSENDFLQNQKTIFFKIGNT